MRDVAKRAGVSLSTVSLVVNGTGYVSDDMRDRVRRAMTALHYVPNDLARNLSQNRANTIGIIVPTIRHPFFATLTANLQHVLAEKGLQTLLCSTADAANGEAEYVDMLRRRLMDGIVMGAHTEHAPDYWTSIHRPVIAFDRVLGEGIPSVGSDHVQGGRLIANLLIRTGARHVVVIGGPRNQFREAAPDESTTFPTVRYHLALEAELAKAGVEYEYIEAGEVMDFAGYAGAVRSVFERGIGGGDGGDGSCRSGKSRVDAIVSSDIGAAMCVREAMARGVRVPDDLQIVAYDGTYLTDLAGMTLTAVRQDFPAIAEQIADRMMGVIEGSDAGDATGGAVDAGAVGGAGEGAAVDTNDGRSGDDSGIMADDREPSIAGEAEHLIPVSLVAGATTRG
ncbi:LacI family DNA-binding transcriptional regulator [Bifidobacterium sp. 64T4]|nr:LacI family DNA-binding transcriptional regulator [Bifidobacterium pongonis]MBW3095624.1 LacI family DNA-binding transcriptional regulator [Bifidobacterium pongonis]